MSWFVGFLSAFIILGLPVVCCMRLNRFESSWKIHWWCLMCRFRK